MFRAKLIEDSTYYNSRRNLLILYFLPAIPGAFIVNYYELPASVTISAILIYGSILVFALKNSKKLTALSKERMLELDDHNLRVKSKGNTPPLDINLDTIDKISISKDYGIPQESMKDIANELSGEAKQNYIIISSSQQTQRFDFIIESYYMLKQFENTIDAWAKKGYRIERV